MKHPVTKTGIAGWYMYRGVRIERDDRERGYWGHWRAAVGSTMQGTRAKLSTDTRAKLLAQIDEWMESNHGRD